MAAPQNPWGMVLDAMDGTTGAFKGIGTAAKDIIAQRRQAALDALSKEQHDADFKLRQAAESRMQAQEEAQAQHLTRSDAAHASEAQAKNNRQVIADRIKGFETDSNPLRLASKDFPAAAPAELASVGSMERTLAENPKATGTLPGGPSDQVPLSFPLNTQRELTIKDAGEKLGKAKKQSLDDALAGKLKLQNEKPVKPEKPPTIGDSGVKEISEWDSALKGLDSSMDYVKKEGIRTGKGVQGGQFLLEKANLDDPQFSGAKARLGLGLAGFVRAMSGKQVSDKERQFLITLQPGPGDSGPSLVQKYAAAREFAANHRDSLIDTYRSAKRDVSGFAPIASPVDLPAGGPTEGKAPSAFQTVLGGVRKALGGTKAPPAGTPIPNPGGTPPGVQNESLGVEAVPGPPVGTRRRHKGTGVIETFNGSQWVK